MKFPLRFHTYATLATVAIASLYSCAPQNREDGNGDHQAEVASARASILAFNDVDQAAKSQISGFLSGYFTLNQALIEDSLDGAKVAAGELLAITKTFEMSKLTGQQMDFYLIESSKIKSGLQDISVSADIEVARTGLATVSEGMYALVKAFHPNESTLYYQYCPMARNNEGANWLSATEELVNPYMGQMMLRCGRTQEKLE